MANFYTTPIDGCFNCPMQHAGDCKQPYADRPVPTDVGVAVAGKLPPPPGCILYDLPLYLHGRFGGAHPDGTTPRDRDAQDAVVALVYGEHGAYFRELALTPYDPPAATIAKLGAALAARLKAP